MNLLDVVSASSRYEPFRNGRTPAMQAPGALVNMIARKDAFVAVANPVALYIAGFAPLGWQTPDGSDPKDFWKIVRGDAAHGLRAVYEVPAAKGFTVGDITINGLPIAFGAQIVDFITIKLVGQAAGIGKNVVPPVTSCLGDGGPAPGPGRS